MELNSGLREMISVMRAALPDMGLKKLTDHVNASLPPGIKVEKHVVRDFLRGLSHINDEGTATNEGIVGDTATKPATNLTAAPRARDQTFEEATKTVFMAFRDAEREYLLNLDGKIDHDLRATIDGQMVTDHPVCHLRHHIEVLLTLKGLKPCTLFSIPHHNDSAARVITDVVLQCLVPSFDKVNIEAYGFKLHYIAADVLSPSHAGYKGVWILADTESPKWPLVREVFLKPKFGRVVPELVVGMVLGYPVKLRDQTRCLVEFNDLTEQQVLSTKLEDVCCVDAMGFYCNEGDPSEWLAINDYYEKCLRAAAEVGTCLLINMDSHPYMRIWHHMMASNGQLAEL